MSFDYGEFSFASKDEVLAKSREFWNPGKTQARVLWTNTPATF